jgi:hypothetical protein
MGPLAVEELLVEAGGWLEFLPQPASSVAAAVQRQISFMQQCRASLAKCQGECSAIMS